jgi:hypothetical protein
MNPREFELVNLDSKTRAAGRPLPRAVELALRPGAPLVADLIAVASGTAPPPVAAAVLAYCAKDPEYAAVLETYRRFARDEDFADPPAEGSSLAGMTTAAFRDGEGPPAAQPESGWTALGLTALGLSANPADHRTLLERLQVWLSVLFEELGLPPGRVGAFLGVVEERLPLSPAGPRLRDLLRGLLAEFTGVAVERIVLDAAFVARAAVKLTIRRVEPDESDLARRYRAFVTRMNPASPAALASLNFDDFDNDVKDDPALSPLHGAAVWESHQAEREGEGLFELPPPPPDGGVRAEHPIAH